MLMGIAVGRIRAMPDNVNRFIRVIVITITLWYLYNLLLVCGCGYLDLHVAPGAMFGLLIISLVRQLPLF